MELVYILKQFSINKPVISVLCLFLVCTFFRVTDIFILGLDEPPINEIILSKTLGLLLIFTYLGMIQSSFGGIGFNSNHIIKNASIGLIFVISGLFAIYGSQFMYLQLKGAKPHLAIEHNTLFSLLAFIIAGNTINVFMEEGLFRGLMISQFMSHISFWKANFLQACIFGIWHMVWPIKNYFLGKVSSVGSLIGMSIGEIFVTSLMGFTMGYLFYKTGSLWAAFLWHFMMNFTQNVLVIKSENLNMDSLVIHTSTTTVKGIAIILVLVITNICIKYFIPIKNI